VIQNTNAARCLGGFFFTTVGAIPFYVVSAGAWRACAVLTGRAQLRTHSAAKTKVAPFLGPQSKEAKEGVRKGDT
jgi:hypothetical protein